MTAYGRRISTTSAGNASDRSQRTSAPINIMKDPRVYRGSVCGFGNAGKAGEEEEEQQMVPSRVPRKVRQRRLQPMMSVRELHDTTHAVKIRQEVPLALHLEEQDVEAVELSAQSCQTDAFNDRPPPGAYIPPKTGLDVSTQVQPESGELFEFAIFVEPVLDVLVSKSIEQSLMEVRQELEMRSIRSRKEVALLNDERSRNASRLLEQREMQLNNAKEKVLAEERENERKRMRMHEKLHSMKLSKAYLRALKESVFESLERKKIFYDPTEIEIESDFMPTLVASLRPRLSLVAVARQISDDIIECAIGRGLRASRDAVEATATQLAERRRASDIVQTDDDKDDDKDEDKDD